MGRPKGSKNKPKDKGAGAEKTPKKRPQQTTMPGTDHDRIAELDAVGAEFFEIRDARMDLTKQEADMQVKGLQLLHKHNRQRYVCIDLATQERYELRIETGDEKLKVKKLAEPKQDTPPAAEVTAS